MGERRRENGKAAHGGKAAAWGEARPMGGKARSAQWGLDLARRRGETIARGSFFGCLASPTILDSVVCWPSFSTGRQTRCTDEAGGCRDCLRDAATTFPRRTDRGRRHFQARRDGRGRRDSFGWGPTGCKTAPHYDFPRSAAGSEGRRVRQGRRAERRVRPSDPTVPKGGASLRAPLAAVGSGQVAPLPALGAHSSHGGRERFGLAAIFFNIIQDSPCPALFHRIN
jgi:hypothetical protein